MLQKIAAALEEIRAEEFDYEILRAASDVLGEDAVSNWRPSLSYLPPENANVGEQLLVEFLGEQYPVTVATNDSTPVFDPDNSRVKA